MTDEKLVQAVQKIIDASKKNSRKFKQTVDVVMNLKNVDLEDPKNRVDEEVVLPHGRGDEARIAIFASGDLAIKAKKEVDLVIKPEELEDLASDKKNLKKVADEYDFFIAEAPLMPTIGKSLGVVLGPRGKMPKPVPPHADVKGLVKTLKSTVRLRSKSKKTFHAVVGKEDMGAEKLAENIDTLVKRLESALAQGKMNISSVYIKTTMGPSERIL